MRSSLWQQHNGALPLLVRSAAGALPFHLLPSASFICPAGYAADDATETILTCLSYVLADRILPESFSRNLKQGTLNLAFTLSFQVVDALRQSSLDRPLLQRRRKRCTR